MTKKMTRKKMTRRTKRIPFPHPRKLTLPRKERPERQTENPTQMQWILFQKMRMMKKMMRTMRETKMMFLRMMKRTRRMTNRVVVG